MFENISFAYGLYPNCVCGFNEAQQQKIGSRMTICIGFGGIWMKEKCCFMKNDSNPNIQVLLKLISYHRIHIKANLSMHHFDIILNQLKLFTTSK